MGISKIYFTPKKDVAKFYSKTRMAFSKKSTVSTISSNWESKLQLKIDIQTARQILTLHRHSNPGLRLVL